MKDISQLLHVHKQNHKLAIRLISPTFGHLRSINLKEFELTHRKPYYFFLFMIDGSTSQTVDLQQFDIGNNELLFILPHQIHQLPKVHKGRSYYKLGFDDETLSLLPKQYSFLVNPYNNQKIEFDKTAAERLKSTFGILENLLQKMGTDPELVLAHLNSLLAEINAAYFSSRKRPAEERLSLYIRFKLFVENNLTDHIAVNRISEALSVNTNTLYNLVKNYSGLSPKEFITNRLMLEAKRRLYYSESSSIKELAFDLGFNDPEYFARLFKKWTGKTITKFVQDLSGN